MRSTSKTLALALIGCLALPAEVADMSGHWVLNVKRSKWGKKPPPQAVEIDIEHKEPSLKYKGSVTNRPEDAPATFTFDGAIDGKEYTVKEGMTESKVSIRRARDSTTASTLRSTDGKIQETTQTKILRDGKTMVREIRHKGPDGTRNWTEIYERG
jgi:hypothetical protein